MLNKNIYILSLVLSFLIQINLVLGKGRYSSFRSYSYSRYGYSYGSYYYGGSSVVLVSGPYGSILTDIIIFFVIICLLICVTIIKKSLGIEDDVSHHSHHSIHEELIH